MARRRWLLLAAAAAWAALAIAYAPLARWELALGALVLALVAGAFGLASRRAAQAAVARIEDRERIIRKQSKDLTHQADALKLAGDTARAAAEAQASFVAHMSHEVRTPLNGIIGITDLLASSDLNAEQRELVETLRKSSASLLKIVDQSLDFSKLEQGHVSLERLFFDVRESVEDVLDTFAPSAAEKGLDLACLMDPETPKYIVGDITRLTQVLRNLVSNAVKFTEQGEVVVRIRPGDDHSLHFSVRDTGIGLPHERRERLFQAFSQAHASTTRLYGGTGLGLAITKRLVTLMGGQIWVESEPDQGSTFHATVHFQSAPPRSAESLRVRHLVRRHVWVVEPRPSTRECLRQLCDELEMRVTTAPERPRGAGESGREAELSAVLLATDAVAVSAIHQWLDERHPEVPRIGVVDYATKRGHPSGEDGRYRVTLRRPVRRAALKMALESALTGHPPTHDGSGSRLDPAMGREHPMRLLVAEDNPINCKVLLTMLDRLGYRADVVNTGREAVAAVEAERYDIVFMDVQMPELDGLEATRRIRGQLPADRQPHIVAVTANLSDAQREECARAGVDDFVAKPIRSPAIVAALDLYIGRSAKTAVGRDSARPTHEPTALDRMRELYDELPEAYLELLEHHRGNVDELLERMASALDEGQLGELRLAAHTLRATAAMFGGEELGAVCRAIEEHAGSADPAAARREIEGLPPITGSYLADIDAELERCRAQERAPDDRSPDHPVPG